MTTTKQRKKVIDYSRFRAAVTFSDGELRAMEIALRLRREAYEENGDKPPRAMIAAEKKVTAALTAILHEVGK